MSFLQKVPEEIVYIASSVAGTDNMQGLEGQDPKELCGTSCFFLQGQVIELIA